MEGRVPGMDDVKSQYKHKNNINSFNIYLITVHCILFTMNIDSDLIL